MPPTHLLIGSMDTNSSSQNEISDAESSELAKAVASLNVAQPASTRRPSADITIRGGTGLLDSGYASGSGSQTTSPEVTKFFPFVGAAGPARRWSILGRKKTKLLRFEKEIPKLTQNRFEDLRELHADSLVKLTRGVPRCRGILMSLKVLGETESSAAPWIFIQCERAVAVKVRRFFKQPLVELDFKPDSPNSYTPRFDRYVHEMPPLTLGVESPSPCQPVSHTHHASDVVNLYYAKNSKIRSQSLCGSKISASVSGQMRTATIGGLISIQTKDGNFQTLGMTAGHFLTQEQYTDGRGVQEDVDDDIDDDDDDDDDDYFDDGQEFELDLDIPDSDVSICSAKGTDLTAETINAPIGHIFKTSQDNIQNQANLDWALFVIEKSSLYVQNVIVLRKVIRIGTVDTTGADREVILLTFTKGPVLGTLSNSWSYLMLAPGNGLVRANALNVSKQTGITYIFLLVNKMLTGV